ncbi:SgrR family transcriptional regulator [Vibrio comitans]|uniref:ABC transporter substrate-binding protein n=1 Tax=Vibrio comitans NBRC 102076 TaxID=1219078 RepID=A0A4Y3IPJ8_9VIBR|nr:SgrR family transcriptional regulator [Vibrio comitans]GEA60995.1 ABC transporter substrate-binding protein [Vibrio comitans NBRC 102076]
MVKPTNTIQLNRLKQLDRYFGTALSVVDSQTLAQIMSCSTRNVAKTMKTLAELGWVNWQPGRGRGIKTQLQIVRSFHTVLIDVLKTYVAGGELNEAARYADIFNYQKVFKQSLPEWMIEFSEDNQRSDKLISLVPYSLPNCHPMHMVDRNAGIIVSAMFDTLVDFEPLSKQFIPRLAHQFYQEGLTHYFRIRPDVHFHNGELLTPEHVKQVLLAHKKPNTIANELYQSIESVEVNRQWVEVTLTFDDPIFLHAIADIHASIYLNNPAEPNFPYGTGAYHWGTKTIDHWTLLKNTGYFAHHGILKSAEFWHVLETNKTSVGHLLEFEDSEKRIDNAPELLGSSLGCKGLCMNKSLDDDIRRSLASVTQEVLKQHYQARHTISHSLFNHSVALDSNAHSRQSESLELPHSLKVLKKNSDALHHFWNRLNEHDVQIEYVDEFSKADVWIENFLIGADPVLDHYYWLLLSASAKRMLTSFKQQQWLAEVQNAPDTNATLSLIEQRYLEQYRVIPLWTKSYAFHRHQTLRGTVINSLGFMDISKIWFDKRES